MLRIIAGEESADSGTVTRRNGLKVALVEQKPDFGGADATALSACEGHDPDVATRMLTQLGIENAAEARIATMSGGQKKRVAIARALPPNLICSFSTNPPTISTLR
jgi:ATP-binding cassette subfamily F protein uup